MTARILFFTTSYPVNPVDRAGPFVHLLARSLVQRGLQVSVLAPASGSARGRSEMEGVAVQRFRFLPARLQSLTMSFGGVPAAVQGAPWRLVQVPAMLAFAAAACARAARHADLLHAHWLPNLLPFLATRRSRALPRVVTLWGSDVEWYERSSRLRPAFRALVRAADGVVAINEHMIRLFAGEGVAAERLHLIPSGVDTSLFQPRDRREMRRRLGLPEGDIIAVAVGSLIRRKGFDTAVAAMRGARDDRLFLVLVGEGPERPQLQALAQREGVADRVIFAGESSIERVAEWMSGADLFLLPSSYEGRPNVVLEAQASGLPVLASDIPGCRDLIEPGTTGVLVPPGRADLWSDAIGSLCADPAERLRLGASARASILEQGLSWGSCAARYADLYRDLLKG